MRSQPGAYTGAFDSSDDGDEEAGDVASDDPVQEEAGDVAGDDVVQEEAGDVLQDMVDQQVEDAMGSVHSGAQGAWCDDPHLMSEWHRIEAETTEFEKDFYTQLARRSKDGKHRTGWFTKAQCLSEAVLFQRPAIAKSLANRYNRKA
jgi:hypothetical protein